MNALTAALEEYANPRNWTWTVYGWVFIDDAEPWGRAQDALEREDADATQD